MRKRLFGLLATTAIVVAACQGAASPSPSEAPSSAPSEPPASTEPSAEPTPIDYDALLFAYSYTPEKGTTGGSIIISDWQAANQLNPAYSNAFANSQVFAATMRALGVVTADGHWKADLAETLPKAATDITLDDSGGGFTVKINMRSGLKWSDGETLDLNDMKYTFAWVMEPDQPGISTLGYDKVDSFEVSDDGLSADVHFIEPYAGWLGLLAGSYILPEHYMSTIPVAEANTWAGPAEACDGTPCLDRVTYKFFPDNKEGMIAAFLAGEIDVAVDLVQADYDAIKVVDPAVGRAILEPAWLYEHWDMNQAGIGRGQGHPALKDVEVRRAMSEAIDKDALFTTVFPGSPLPEKPACAAAVPTNYWYNPDVECLSYDLDAANARLDAAGYVDSDGDGVRNMPGGGDNLDFVHCTSTAGFRQTGGEFLAAAMKDIGITLELNFVDSTAVYFANWPDVAADTKCNLAHGNYDTAEFAWVLSFDLFGNYYYAYHSEQIPTEENNGDGYNYTRFDNAEMDAALNTLKDAILTEDQLKAAYTVQDVHASQLPEIVMYYRNEARGVAANLKNFLKNPSTASDMWNIEDWFVTQ